MYKLLAPVALATFAAFVVQDLAAGHGGSYRGPTDYPPTSGPGAGPAGGGGSQPGGTPTGPGPTTGGAPGPMQPGLAGGPTQAAGPVTGGLEPGVDATTWQTWWGFNSAPYLDLKKHVHSGRALTGSEEFFLGFGEKDQAVDLLRPSQETIQGRIVPALLGALERERSNDVVTGAMIALAKIGAHRGEAGSSEAAEAIAAFLGDPSQEVAETAAVALGILGDDSPRNVGLLVALLENDDVRLRELGVPQRGAVPDRTRAFAAYGLGLVGHGAREEARHEIVSALIAMLAGEAAELGTRDVAVACVTALGLTPLTAGPGYVVSPLQGELERPAEVDALEDQVQWLLALYDDESWNHLVRAHVPTAIGRLLGSGAADESWLRERAAERFLADLSRHAKAKREVQQSCALALGALGDCDEDPLDARIRAALIDLPERVSDEQTRYFGMIALAQIAGRPGHGAGDATAGLVGKRGARSFLFAQLGRGKVQARTWAALALGVLEGSLADHGVIVPPDTGLALRTALAEAENPAEIGALAIALGVLRDPQASATMLERLDDIGDVEAQGNLCVALGLLNDGAAVEPIQALVAGSKYKPELLRSAAIGLGLLGDKQAVTTLVTMLGEARGLSSQAALASALGTIGDTRSVEPLIEMLEDSEKTALARGFAAAALGIVADKEPLPWNAKLSLGVNYRAATPTLTAQALGNGILDIL